MCWRVVCFVGKATRDRKGWAAIVAIKVAEAMALHLSHSRIKNQPVLNNWMHVQDYYTKLSAHEPIKHIVILCLNNQSKLIGDETILIGAIKRTAVYPARCQMPY